ncbi:MAG: HAMP domain-containing histidine kinase [Holophagaceae bacterium]|nr:HAMP domain-containing histidine kinase [Holophagaceae bacterium]
MKEVVEAFQPVATHKSIRLEGACDQAPIILGDERWLRQVLANLLDNALKFTPSGGHVRVELQTEGSEVQIGVEDTGPGIPAEQLPRIFERFYQGDSARTRSDTQGTGLGLAISAWIVEAHGGNLTAVNRSDTPGCRMTMRLPCPT